MGKQTSTLLRIFFLVSIALGSLLVSFVAHAQGFEIKSHTLSAGYGAGNYFDAISDNYYIGFNDRHYQTLGAGYVRYEFGVSENFGLGLNAAAMQNVWTFSTNNTVIVGYDQNGSAIIQDVTVQHRVQRVAFSALARFNFHIPTTVHGLDPYLGVGLGYRKSLWSQTSDTADPNDTDYTLNHVDEPLGFDLGLGLRYYFTPNIGAYAEIGIAKSILQAGVTVRLPTLGE